MKRRELIKAMAITGGLAFAPRWIWATGESPAHGQRLISIFLRGAADGLTVCAPLGESAYFDARPTLALSEANALNLDGFFALHPAASGLKTLFDFGELAFIHATGLMTAQRSHFEAQAAMEQGIDAFELAPGTGWLGRWLAGLAGNDPLTAVAFDTAVPESLAGLPAALAVGAIDQFNLALDARAKSALASAYARDPLLAPTADAALNAIDALAPVSMIPAGSGYPAGPLGTALADTARLIKADSGLVAAAINGGGWDHHDDQLARIEPLLAELGQALAAFRDDLGTAWLDTTVVIQTEFGRRVAENASAGTDHGHGGVMLIAGGQVNGGRVVTDWPGLASGALSDGQDLAVTTDYRQVLAEVLVQRFGLSDVGQVFEGFAPKPWLGLIEPPGSQARTGGAALDSIEPPSAPARPAFEPPEFRIPAIPTRSARLPY